MKRPRRRWHSYLASQSEQINAPSEVIICARSSWPWNRCGIKRPSEATWLCAAAWHCWLARWLNWITILRCTFVAFSPDGTKVLTGSNDMTARIWDASSGQELHKLTHDDSVYSVAFSPDGTKVLTGSNDSTARIWDASSGQELHKLPHEDSVYAVAFSPDGTKVLTGSYDNTARIWDVSSGQELHKLPHGDSVWPWPSVRTGQRC